MQYRITRRQTLRLLALSGATWLASPAQAFSDVNKSMMRKAIPSSGEMLPVIGLGTWIQFDVARLSAEIEELKKVLKNMKDIGGRIIDSSPMYGRSEETIGDLATGQNIGENFFYATKVWTRGKQAGIEQMNASFRKMRRSKMDLMQIHNLVDWKTHMQTLRQWKTEGKIRYFGITHYTDTYHDELAEIIAREKPDFAQFNYSIRNRNAEKRLLSTARDSGTAVIINQPFETGALFNSVNGKQLPGWAAEYEITNWAQFFLKYIISHPAVTCTIPGTSNPRHLVENMETAYGKMPDDKGRKRMADYFASL
jgi:diketogulonate reductase-like aldo/keto reductase